MPKVSVIVPVYGVEKYIERCARSLFDQTLDDMEFIFVDDCTPDRSIEILKSVIDEYRLRFAEKKYEVRIERMPTNSGLAAVRRHGIQLATGDYIIHCDSDDWVDKDIYRAMYEKALEEHADMVVCDYSYSNGIFHRGIKGFISMEKETFIKDMLYLRTTWAVWNKLVKRELYDQKFIYPAGAMAEDMLISTQLALRSDKISFLRRELYYYFNNPTSIVNATSFEEVMRKFKQGISNAKLLESIISRDPEYINYLNPLYFAIHHEKCLLIPYLHIVQAKNAFYNTYKGLEAKLIVNSEVSIKYRLWCVFILFRIYPLIQMFRHGK